MAQASSAEALPGDKAAANGTPSADDSDAVGVRFGKVHVREMASHVRVSSTGTYRLGMDWTVQRDFSRNVDTWEAERGRTRATRGRNLAVKGQAAIQAALADGAAPASSAKPSGPVREVESWHIKADGRIYQSDGEHSSVIAEIDGTMVTTQSGSRYKLGAVDAAIRHILNCTGAAFDPENPLENVQALLYAEKLVYGDAGRTAARVGDLLSRLEAQLDVPELTAHHFDVIRHVFAQLGIVFDREAASPVASAPAAVAPHGAPTGRA